MVFQSTGGYNVAATAPAALKDLLLVTLTSALCTQLMYLPQPKERCQPSKDHKRKEGLENCRGKHPLQYANLRPNSFPIHGTSIMVSSSWTCSRLRSHSSWASESASEKMSLLEESEGRESTSSLASVRAEAWRSTRESSGAAIMTELKGGCLLSPLLRVEWSEDGWAPGASSSGRLWMEWRR